MGGSRGRAADPAEAAGGPSTTSLDERDPAVLHVTPEIGPDLTSLRLAGEMDLATAGQLVEIVRSLSVGNLKQVRLNLSDLAFVDAAGLTALLQVKALVRARDGRLFLYRPSSALVRFLAITGLTGAFEFSTGSPVPNDR